jgi:nitrate/TMAO reductase-like tetraheme cytochrome c subunit
MMISVSIAVLFMTTVSAQEIIDESCFHCHPAQVNEFRASVHFNTNTCADCHGGDINISGTVVSINVMHTNFTGKPSPIQVTDFCFKCHVNSTSAYKESIHWQKLNEGRPAATCTDCHGTHRILSSKDPNSSTFSANVAGTCAICHENQTKMQALYYGISTDRFDTYKKSYHYKSYMSGGRLLATCSDCHEYHDIRPASDPKSAVNPANLPSTCGKKGCHEGANNAYIYGGKIHEEQSVYLLSIDAKRLVTYFYILMILFELTFTIGLIFLGITSNFEIRRRH